MFKMRDFRNAPASPAQHARGSTITGIIIGLLLGLSIAVAVAFFVNRQKSPFVDRMNHPVEGIENSAAPPATAAKPGPASPAEVTAKPAATDAAGKPRFDFYTILPGDKEATPRLDKTMKNQPVVSTGPTAPAEKSTDAPGTKYYLQVGSFSSETDADNLKAKIALMGMQAEVKTATVQDKGVMHRVRLGPYKSSEEMTQARNELAQNGLTASVIPVKPKN
jgi:cell division protein FtsN